MDSPAVVTPKNLTGLSPYVPKTAPYAHQAEAFRRSADAAIFGLLLEMRLGKTKVCLDTVAYQYLRGNVDALLIIAAPNGVHRAWVTDEIPTHLPDSVLRRCLIWRSGQHRRAAYAREMEGLLKRREGLAVLAVNAEALNTPALRAYLKRYLTVYRKVFVVYDETSHWARSPGATRTKIAVTVSKHPSVKFKRILDGTPAGENPLDLYSQVALLSHSVFGFTSYSAFKNHYAVWETGRNYTTGTDYQVLKEYRNLDELQRKLASVSYRCTRAECWDLPPKVYQRVYFQLSPAQRKVYDRLREEYEAELAGETVTVQHVLTRYLRLQQITCNYWPSRDSAVVCGACGGEGCDECNHLGVTVVTEPERRIGDEDPRLDALKSVMAQPGAGPFVVWCRFHHDVDAVFGLASRARLRPVRFDGRVPEVDRMFNLEAFQTGRSHLLVGTAGAGGRGRRMSAVRTMVYYSNDYSLLNREQSEDRGEHAERAEGVSVVDLLAEDTVDEDIVAAHLGKRRLADIVLARGPGARLR